VENNAASSINVSPLKTCAICGTEKPLSGFYQKSSTRFDPLCKECRKNHERLKYKVEKKREELVPRNIVPVSAADLTDQSVDGSDQKIVAPKEGETEPIFKEYRYPDGRLLKLTRSEFEEVAEVFRMLINQNRKNKGKPLLMG
jgi:hypothetical protein